MATRFQEPWFSFGEQQRWRVGEAQGFLQLGGVYMLGSFCVEGDEERYGFCR